MSIRREDYCCESLELVENYAAAKADNFAGWCIHHKLEIKKDGTRVSVQELKDQGLYFGRPAEELVFMRCCEHATLHHKGKAISAETLQKMSEAQKGKHHSAETRQKMSKSLKGKHWWNNGVSCKYSRECPGEGWTRGRLRCK